MRPAQMAFALFAPTALVCLFGAGCDSRGDDPITTTDVAVLTRSCSINGGLKRAERVWPLFKRAEWRIDCVDGARFVVSEPKS